MNDLKKEFNEAQNRVKREKTNYKWLKSISARFWLLEKIYKNRPIIISNWECMGPPCEHDHPCEKGLQSCDLMIDLPPRIRDVLSCVAGYFSWVFEFKEFPNIKDYLPWRFRERWVFCINAIDCFYDKWLDEPFDLFYKLKFPPNSTKPNWYSMRDIDQGDRSYEWVRKNAVRILAYRPVITYDDVWTPKEFLTKEDLVNYTRLWLRKWYPNLADRAIIWRK